MDTNSKSGGDEQPKLWITSDQTAFFDEQAALEHSALLDDSTVVCMTKEEVEREASSLLKDDGYEE